MQEPLVKRIPFAKILIGLVLVFFLSLGLCGLTLVMTVRGSSPGAHMNKLVDPAAIAAMVGMFGSIAALIVTGIVWMVMSIANSAGRKVSQPQERIDESDDTNSGKRD